MRNCIYCAYYRERQGVGECIRYPEIKILTDPQEKECGEYKNKVNRYNDPKH